MTVLLGAVTNIVLDPVFIFLFKMGVKGAALATIISQFLSAIWVLKFLTGKNAILKLKVENFKIKLPILKKIVYLGLSSFIMSVTNSVVQIVNNITLKTYGGDIYIGVMTVINSIREIIMMPVGGVTNGSQPVLGFNYGAKKYWRVKKGIKFMSIVCIIYSCVTWAVLRICPELFIRIFSSDPKLIQKGIPAISIYYFGFFMMSLQMAGQSTYLALGKSKQAIFFSLLRKIIIVVPLTLILPRMYNLGPSGVFLAEPISNFIGGAACYATLLFTVIPRLKEE